MNNQQKLSFKSLSRKIALLAILAMLSSCARQISSNVYSAGHVGETSMTYSGFIRNVREVCVEQHEQLEENQFGMASGGIAGGVLGNVLGKGNLLPTAVGAVAGTVAGSLIEKKLKQQQALEYVVELDNGGLMTIVQGTDCVFEIGQPVYVIVSQCGRSRIVSQ